MPRDFMKRRVDVPRLVANDLYLDVGWKLRGNVIELRLDVLDNLYGIGA